MTHGFSLTFNFPFQIRTGPLIGRLSNELPDNPENTCAEHRRALKLGAGCFWIYYQARIQNSIHASDPDLTVVIDLDLNDRCHIRQETPQPNLDPANPKTSPGTKAAAFHVHRRKTAQLRSPSVESFPTLAKTYERE